MRNHIGRNIHELESDEKNNLEYLSKWYWLANYFDLSVKNSGIDELNNDLFFDLLKYNFENAAGKIKENLVKKGIMPNSERMRLLN